MLPADLAYRTGALELGSDLALGALVAVDGDDLALFAQLGATGAWVREPVRAGLELRATVGSPLLQTSAEPFLELVLGRAFARLLVNIALNTPFGVLDSRDVDVWSARLAGGAGF